MTPGKTGGHTGEFELESPEGGDTIFCIAAFGALCFQQFLFPPVTPGVIIVSPLRGYAKPTFTLKNKKKINISAGLFRANLREKFF